MLKRLNNAFKRQVAKLSLSHPNWDKLRKKDRKRRWDAARFFGSEGYIMSFFRTTWVRPFDEEPFKPIANYAWPLYSSPRYNRELTKFMFSFRDETSVNRNINNLMFITGPEQAGKSWFFKQNIEKFKGVSSGTYCISLDLEDINALNFETFLDLFEGKISSFLVERAEDVFKGAKLVRWEMIIDLLKHSHDPLYLDIHLSKLLEKSVKSEDVLMLSNKQKKEIGNILGTFVNRKLKTTPVVDNIEKVLEVLAEGYISELGRHRSMVKAALDLSQGFYLQEELSSCPIKNFAGCYRTGLKTSWFLLDVLNLVGGYHEMNIRDLEYPHVLVTLGNPYTENVQKLLSIETNEDRPVSWIESIALKLHVSIT